MERSLRIDRLWIWFTAALLILMAGWSIGPRVPDKEQNDKCVVNVHLPGPFGLSLNCDSPEFMRLATHPSVLLEPKNTRQARPGLILAAAVIALPFKPLAGLAETLVTRAQRPDIDPKRIANALAEFLPAFIAYIALNLILLLLSFHYFRKLVGNGLPRDMPTDAIVLAIGVLMIATYPVNKFIWTPHTQMFNTLVPLLCVHAVLRAWFGGMQERKFALWMGALVGFGNLAYGLFVIMVPCVILAALADILRTPATAARAQRLLNLAIFLALCVAPYAVWYAFVVLVNGEFYYHEFTFPQHTWMRTALEQGIPQFLQRLWGFIAEIVVSALWQAVPLAVMMLWVFATITRYRVSLPQRTQLMPLAFAAFFVSTVILAFYVVVGLGGPRTAYSAIVPLIGLVGAFGFAVAKAMTLSQRRILAIGCLAVAGGQFALAIAHDWWPRVFGA